MWRLSDHTPGSNALQISCYHKQEWEEKGSLLQCSPSSRPCSDLPNLFLLLQTSGQYLAKPHVAMVIKSLHMTSYFGNLEYSSSDIHTTAKCLEICSVRVIYLLAISLFQSIRATLNSQGLRSYLMLSAHDCLRIYTTRETSGVE